MLLKPLPIHALLFVDADADADADDVPSYMLSSCIRVYLAPGLMRPFAFR